MCWNWSERILLLTRRKAAGNLVGFPGFPTLFSGQNWPDPSDGEMASIRCVTALGRATSPPVEWFRAAHNHFSRQIQHIYEFVT